MDFTDTDRQQIQQAKNLLENPGLAARITNLVGTPIEMGFDLLPQSWNERIGAVTQTALMKASDAAIFTMQDVPGTKTSSKWHTLGAAVSGGIGGAFGLAGLSAELPISTTLMLRSIADIARSEGESISSIETKLACMEVFALGGKSKSDDGAESGYYAVRYALASSVAEAAKYITQKGLTKETAPALLIFITKIAERFGIQVTQKAAAQAIPAIGAATGAIINSLFISHFQDMARGHFVIRKMERKYSPEQVSGLYQSLPRLGVSRT